MMLVDGKAVLQVIVTATYFSYAKFVDAHGKISKQSGQRIWFVFVINCVLTYFGYSNRLWTDRGSEFLLERWKQLTKRSGVKLCLSDVEVYSSLMIKERYHEPLRRIKRKTRFIHSIVSLPYVLKRAVKPMDDTTGEACLVPSRLAFDILPRFLFWNTNLKNKNKD